MYSDEDIDSAIQAELLLLSVFWQVCRGILLSLYPDIIRVKLPVLR